MKGCKSRLKYCCKSQGARLNDKLFREIVKLSYFNQGPRLAQELLNKKGIPLVFLPHLPKTFLDGACFNAANGRPVIGMTLRHDRLDNFWFRLIRFMYYDRKKFSFAFMDVLWRLSQTRALF